MARCTADVIHSYSGTRYSLNRRFQLSPVVNGQREHARMDLVFNLNGSATYLDVAIVSPFFQHVGPHCSSQHPPRPHGQESWEDQIRQISTHQPDPFRTEKTGRNRPPQKVHQLPHARCRQSATWHPRHLVSHPECPPQRHLHTTTHSRLTTFPRFTQPYTALHPVHFVHTVSLHWACSAFWPFRRGRAHGCAGLQVCRDRPLLDPVPLAHDPSFALWYRALTLTCS